MKLLFRTVMVCCLFASSPTIAQAANPCADVKAMRHFTQGLPLVTIGEYYYACAVILQPNNPHSFDMYLNAADEYSVAAHAQESNENIAYAFLLYTKSYDAYVRALSLDDKYIHDQNSVQAKKKDVAQAIRRIAPNALPLLK